MTAVEARSCVPPTVRRCSVRSRCGDRANHGDDERGDEEEECDGEECGEVEGRLSARLREYALEWPDEWLGDPVKTRYQRLVRVRTEELQDEAKQQQDLEHGEEERDHAGHRPH